MTFSCPVCASWDLSAGAMTHSYWTSSAPPAPDTYIFAFEMLATMQWTGVWLGLGSMSRSVVVSPEDEWVVLEDHDVGPLILDVTVPANNVWLPITWLLSGRAVMFSASSVEFEGTAVGTPYFFMPMITCADPVPLPTAIPIGMQYRHQVYVGVTGMDALMGILKTAASVAIDAAFAKAGGDLKKSKFAKSAATDATQTAAKKAGMEAAKEAADEGADKAAQKARKKAAKEAVHEDAVADAAADQAEKKAKDAAEEAAEEARQEAMEEAREEAAERAREEAAERARKKAAGEPVGRAPAPVAKHIAEEPIEKAGEEAAERARKEVIDEAREEAAEKARREFREKLARKKREKARLALKTMGKEGGLNVVETIAHNLANFLIELPFELGRGETAEAYLTLNFGPAGNYGMIVKTDGEVSPVHPG